MTIVTARKQSLGQDNIFTNVCHSVHKGEGVASQHASQVTWPGGSASGGLHPGWVCIQREFRQVCLRGCRPPPPRDTWDTTGYGQQVGDTHSTGMFSCVILGLILKILRFINIISSHIYLGEEISPWTLFFLIIYSRVNSERMSALC